VAPSVASKHRSLVGQSATVATVDGVAAHRSAALICQASRFVAQDLIRDIWYGLAPVNLPSEFRRVTECMRNHNLGKRLCATRRPLQKPAGPSPVYFEAFAVSAVMADIEESRYMQAEL
jgi:hypothetical protein